MNACTHTITQGRQGESGSWCVNCGEKIYAVEERVCSECEHHKRLLGGSICAKHLMCVVPDMHVTFKLSEGTCWVPSTEQKSPI